MRAVRNPVAIVGGGITALTAAFRLKQHNIPVHLFEASSRVGGVVRSVRLDGHLVEFGPNSILETSPIISDLICDLGLQARRQYSLPQAENRYIVRNQKPVLVPLSPGGLLRTPLFSTAAKLRVLLEPLVPRAPRDTEESLASFVRRRLGEEFLDYAINPFVAGVYAGDPALLSVEQAFPKLHALEQKYRSLFLGQFLGARERRKRGEVSKDKAPKFSFDAGLQVLIDGLSDRLGPDIQLSSPVTTLDRRDGEWIVQAGSDTPAAGPFSAILLAVPAYGLARMKISGVTGFDLSSFYQVYYPPVASVVLSFNRRDVVHPLDGFGVLVPEKERFNILGALFSSSLFPNRAPNGEVTLTSFVGGCRAPQLVSQSPDELVDLTCRDLARLLDIRGEPTFHHVAVYPRAIPQYNLGFGRFKERMADVESQAPGVFIAGNSRDGVSISDSILSGHNVAARIENFLHSRSQAILQDIRSAA